MRYELNLRRNITIIQGDSATGKTTLIQIINNYLSSRTGPGTDVICKKKCAVLSGDLESILIRLERLSDTIVFANEQEHFLYPKRFAAAVLKSDCYFVFITRDDLHTLPYSVNEIYCLKNSGYYQNTRQVYNSLHQIYPESQVHDMIAPTMILTEDIVDVQGETRSNRVISVIFSVILNQRTSSTLQSSALKSLNDAYRERSESNNKET